MPFDLVLAADVLYEARNGPAVAAYLASSTVAALVEAAVAVGMRPDDDYKVPRFAVEQKLLWLLAREGIATLAALDALLRDGLDRAPALLGDLDRLAEEGGLELWAIPHDLMAWMLAVLRRVDGWVRRR